ncbi:MAG: tetratricopeptide repeat protein, partial [Myxococcaceae bacterium]|nr:tetratricopeptide repeat protein [Myxococcaceae bacterium]
MQRGKVARRRFRGVAAAALVLGSAPAWSQTPALREALRLQRPGVLAQARAEAEACAKRTPACADAGRLGLLLGTLLVAEGQAAEAASVLSRATPPTLLVPHHAFAMGQARLALGDAAGAVEQLRRASQDGAPGALAERARTRLGEALLAAGQPGEALPLLDAAVKREPTPELLVQRARARHATGDAKGAGADLRSVVVGFPAHPLAQEAQAQSVQLLGAPLTLTYEERLTRARGLLDAGRAEAALVELVALRKDKLARGAAAAARLALQRGRTL